MRFLYGNNKAEDLCGYRRQEMIGRKYYETGLVDSKELVRIAFLASRHLRSSMMGPYSFTIIRKDRSRKALDVTVRLITLEGTKVLLCFAQEPAAPGAQDDDRSLEALGRAVLQMNKALSPVTVCCTCKRIQDPEGDWVPEEYFFHRQFDLDFSHGYCPDCLRKLKEAEGLTDICSR